MKPSARVALIVALATTAPTWASLPFYSPDYTFDSATGTGYKGPSETYYSGDLITNNGRSASPMRYFESNTFQFSIGHVWRGGTGFPVLQIDPSHPSAIVIDMNRTGRSCGFTSTTAGNQAVVWREDGSRSDLPRLSAPASTNYNDVAYDMNDAGFAVGEARKFTNGQNVGQRPVLWTPSGQIIELTNPLIGNDNVTSGVAFNISSDGFIAGYVIDEHSIEQAIRWQTDGSAQVLTNTTTAGLIFDGTIARMSNNGFTVGTGRVGNDKAIGVLWNSNGDAIQFENIPDSISWQHFPVEVNKLGYSVGDATLANGSSIYTNRAVRWSPSGEIQVLARLPDAPINFEAFAIDINDLNYTVGWGYGGALLWAPDGGVIKLDTLIDSTEWTFSRAAAITNTGWITGTGQFDPIGSAPAYSRAFSILVPFAGTYGMGDANFDESIDFADLLIVAQNYGTETNGSLDVGDFNLDGSVNFTDLLAIAQNYGVSVSSLNVVGNLDFTSDWQRAQAMVPEPGVMGLMIGALVMLRRR